MTVFNVETSLDTAIQAVAEAEQRQAGHVGRMTEMSGEEQARARHGLVEIEHTLVLARAHLSLLRSLGTEA
ncbi:hypothetical protein [Methylobacterium soli]|uniref:Uncharacterized protein n=1 Tax=Methylobacterium soli TaxID=553447 RepID=A0A6L3T1U0_9HYPH|nr:hypothetical protein [Methylobacterium soli]KAB1080600.1 hypothetical protein F6X53_05270 [Methylobacterium soli]GJE41520.1 hypothetical protein AEGHOMDF_0686 [Methylobacterium soli]